MFNVIGEENFRWFLLFLAVHVGMCAYGSFVVGNLFYGLILKHNLLEVVFVDRYTGEEIKASNWIIFQYLFSTRMMESGVFLIMSVMSIALGLFLGYYVWLTSRGLTSNEAYKWDQIKKWYKRELKRYEQAVKNGQIDATTGKPIAAASRSSSSSSKPIVTDGDVTCTSGDTTDNTASQQDDHDDDDRIFYPGPPPVNIYNRGIVENWKEVIFPLSLQKVKTKPKET